MLSYALFRYCIIYMPLLYYIYALIALVKLEVVASIIV